MQSTATFRFCGTLRFAPIQNLRYSGQGTAGMVVRAVQLQSKVYAAWATRSRRFFRS